MSISDESSDLFITEVDAERKFRSRAETEDLLVNVRKDHVKVREVVNAFRAKVDRLIDKQRHEYIQAYESHMQDVQKELHSMREKVFEIANDDTKNERTEKLKSDLDTFKDEAIQLETDADQLRITMSNLVRRIYAVGKINMQNIP
jgi:chromosome segregation ATPase